MIVLTNVCLGYALFVGYKVPLYIGRDVRIRRCNCPWIEDIVGVIDYSLREL